MRGRMRTEEEKMPGRSHGSTFRPYGARKKDQFAEPNGAPVSEADRSLSLDCAKKRKKLAMRWVQKSEAHPLTFQSLPASLQKHRGWWHQQRSSNRSTSNSSTSSSTDSSFFVVLDHEIEAHLLTLQLFTHSFAETPGWRGGRNVGRRGGEPKRARCIVPLQGEERGVRNGWRRERFLTPRIRGDSE